MKNCRKCNENLFSDQYDICMTCYELENTPMNNIDPKQLTAIEIKLDHLTTNLFRLQKSVEANNVYESGHLYLTDVIEDKYKYYSGFSYNKDLTALAKLNYLTDIFFDKRDDAECQKLDQQYNDALLDNWVADEENEALKEERDWYKLALEKICKRQGLRPAPSLEECKYIASNALELYNVAATVIPSILK